MSKIQTGQAGVAHELMQQLIATLKKQSNPSEKMMASMEALNGYALHAMGNDDQASAKFKKYIPTLLNQLEIDAENQVGGSREQDRLGLVLEGYISTLSAISGVDKNSDFHAAEAFKLADVARGSGVQRALTASAARANIKDAKLAELARSEQDAQQRIGSLERVLSSLLC